MSSNYAVIEQETIMLGAWRQFKIDDCWGDTHRNLDYTHHAFNNSEDVVTWQRLGYTQTRFTGDMYDMRSPEPACIPALRNLFQSESFAWSFYRMRPGDVMPEHSDSYVRFCELHQIHDVEQIVRWVIFLEDWASGHYFEIAGTPLTSWQKGTVICWHGTTPHLAANVGKTPRYTLQITGLIDI